MTDAPINWQEKWDERFSIDGYVYGTAPNSFLTEVAEALKPESRILCLGAGEGRNAVWLAQQGHRVTAIDFSQQALNKGRALADRNGVTVDWVRGDLETYEVAPSSWDVVLCFFLHTPPAIRKRTHQLVQTALTTDGLFVLEAYHPRQIEYGTGGPPQVDWLMDLSLLANELPELSPIIARELVRNVTEGVQHTGEAAVVQLLAKKSS